VRNFAFFPTLIVVAPELRRAFAADRIEA